VQKQCTQNGMGVTLYPMDAAEEVLRNIEYVRCPVCHGSRTVRACARCGGWGFTGDPPSVEERMKLGLRALWSDTVLDVTPPRKRLKLPLRKRHA
jgi:hypothetical protein